MLSLPHHIGVDILGLIETTLGEAQVNTDRLVLESIAVLERVLLGGLGWTTYLGFKR